MNQEFFKTTDLNLTVFLIVKGKKLEDILNHSKRKTFVFKLTPQLKNLVEVFNFAEEGNEEVMTDAREIMKIERELKTKLQNVI
jgi:hypothetical protein